jgi:hypothetical protein
MRFSCLMRATCPAHLSIVPIVLYRSVRPLRALECLWNFPGLSYILSTQHSISICRQGVSRIMYFCHVLPDFVMKPKGTRIIYLTSFCFTIITVACGTSHRVHQLISCRGVQTTVSWLFEMMEFCVTSRTWANLNNKLSELQHSSNRPSPVSRF